MQKEAWNPVSALYDSSLSGPRHSGRTGSGADARRFGSGVSSMMKSLFHMARRTRKWHLVTPGTALLGLGLALLSTLSYALHDPSVCDSSRS